MSKYKIRVFQNGNVAVRNEDGQQVTGLQDSLFNYPYISKLAKLVSEGNEIEYQDGGTYDVRAELQLRIQHLKSREK